MRVLLLLSLLCGVLCCASATPTQTQDVYVFQGNPYQEGFDPLEGVVAYTLTRLEKGVKYRTIVYAPKTPGNYAAFFFVGGLGGIVPAEFYTGLLRTICAKGFIVVALDNILGGVSGKGALAHLDWLRLNLQNTISKHVSNVTVAWSHIGLGGHSGGAQTVLDMVLAQPTIANGTLFLEGGWFDGMLPKWWPWRKNITLPVPFHHPAFIFNTQLATRRSFVLPTCGEDGQGDTLYDGWTCPRLKMNVTSYGHCDMLDEVGWEACHLGDFCYTDKTNDRPLYRSFIKGLFSSFLIRYVQGNEAVTKFFTDQSNFLGVQVTDFQYDLTCA